MESKNCVDRYVNKGRLLDTEQQELENRWVSALWEYEIPNNSDRGMALFACSALEDAMRRALESLFVADNKLLKELFESGNAPLMSGSSRRKLLMALGVLGAAAGRDIGVIAKIRNRFAHTTSADVGAILTFDVPDIDTLCGRLVLPKILLWCKDQDHVTHYWENVSDVRELRELLDAQLHHMSNREKYWRTCQSLTTFLYIESRECGHMVGPRRLLNYRTEGFTPTFLENFPPDNLAQACGMVQLIPKIREGIVSSSSDYFLFSKPSHD